MIDIPQSGNVSETLLISRFESDGRAFILNSPLAVEVELNADGLWVYHHEKLNLYGYVSNRDDAIEDLNRNFRFMYEEIAEEAEANLDGAARELRRCLLGIVAKSVETAAHA